MATLRTFQVPAPFISRSNKSSLPSQTEIDEHSRELAKQRAVQAAADKEKEKENKKPSKGKSKDDGLSEPLSPDAEFTSATALLEIEEKFIVHHLFVSCAVSESVHFRRLHCQRPPVTTMLPET